MPLLSVAKFAAHLDPPVSRQRINELCNRGDLIRDTDGKIDTDNPHNARWLTFRKECPAPTRPPGRWGPQVASPSQFPNALINGDNSVPMRPATLVGGETINEDEVADLLTRLVAGAQLKDMTYNEVQKVGKIEQALKVRVEREHKRRDLIERSLVRTVFGRIYQIDSQQLRTLGSKLAPEVAGLMGIDDPVIVLMVEQRIDGEILKSLAHIKRIFDEFLVAQGAEPLPTQAGVAV